MTTQKKIEKPSEVIAVQDLTVLIDGVYSDGVAIYLDVDEVIKSHEIADTPEIRQVIREDALKTFPNMPIYEVQVVGANLSLRTDTSRLT
jgi:hypothetical protein